MKRYGVKSTPLTPNSFIKSLFISLSLCEMSVNLIEFIRPSVTRPVIHQLIPCLRFTECKLIEFSGFVPCAGRYSALRLPYRPLPPFVSLL